MRAQVLQDEGLMLTMLNHNAIKATKETSEACLPPARPLEPSIQPQVLVEAKRRASNGLEGVFKYEYLLPPVLPSSLRSAQLAQQHVPRPQSAKLIS